MKTLENYLDEFKSRMNIESDYELAKLLGVSRQQISGIRSGRIAIGRTKCIRIASGLKIDPLEIIATIEAAKEKNPDVRALWVRLAKEKVRHLKKAG
ncbi:MAG TPA: helix-turn-helix domain-containing protein [Cellvibrio sp.]|nr:helix-turn-helix domain-containing protein [Cellvibrio sp.]